MLLYYCCRLHYYRNRRRESIINDELVSEADEYNSILDLPPQLRGFYIFFGFFMSIGWINIIANEVVNILTTLGVISTIDLGVLGLTVLTWGNSLNDVIACGAVARRGFYKMAISGAISGPLLNILLGAGFGLTFLCLSKGGSSHVSFDIDLFISCISAMVCVIFIITLSFIQKWNFTKAFGVTCIIFYIVSVVIVVLGSTGLF